MSGAALSRAGGVLSGLRGPSEGLITLLTVALIAGGGGVSEAFGNLAVQLTALFLLAVHGPALAADLRAKRPRGLLALTAASCLLPLAQLAPMPPALWQGLPGRELVAASLDLAGGRGWFPVSLDRARTLLAFVGTIAPAAVLVLGLPQPADRLVTVQRWLVWLGCACAVFGSVHLLNPSWGDLYAGQRPLPGVLVGTFADRNAAAVFFVCCLLLLIGLPDPPRAGRDLALRVAAAAILAVAVVLTRSRSGMALLLLPAFALAWRLARELGRAQVASARAGGNGGWLGRAVLVVAAAVVLGLVASSGQVRTSAARFGEGDGMRAEMRADALFVAKRYWPVGSGMSTFDEVFQVDESLEYLSPRRAGRAHMDYLELAIEAGAAGLALLAGWLAWCAFTFWRALLRPHAWPARTASLALVAIAAQSLVSFPLRNQAMLCFAALLVVILARSPALVPRREDDR